MERERHITIHEWMLELGIGGNDLLAYALVFGFNMDGKSTFRGSLDYLAYWLGSTRRTAANVLQRLQELGLIEKREIVERGVKFTEFVPTGKNCTSSADFSSKMEKFSKKQEKIAPNNNRNIYRDRDNNPPIYNPPFDFYKALLTAGVSEETAQAWLAVRKAKKCVNTELAFKETMKEVGKSGQSAEQCIRFSASRSWAGFKAEWLEREQNGGAGTELRPKYVDNITFMIEQRKRRLAEEAAQQSYNPNDDLPDEQ